MGKCDIVNRDFNLSDSVVMKRQAPSKIDEWMESLSIEFLRGNSSVVSVLRLSGLIGKYGMRSGLTLESINDSIEEAFKPRKLKAVCLLINSPGGSPVQSELIAGRIIQLAKEKGVPVYSFIEDVAASGGYWLACAGDKIYASRSSIVGSIGVVAASFGFSQVIDKIGIERRVYTQGKNKSILDPFLPQKTSDVDILTKAQQQVHEHFIDYVKQRRSNCLTQSDDILFDGSFWSGAHALDFGLIDGIDNFYSFARENFDEKVAIKYIKSKQSWFRKKLNIEGSIFGENIEEILQRLQEYLITTKFF